MKKTWLWLAAVAGGLFLLGKTGKAGGIGTTPLTITWEPGAGTEWYMEDGTARDYALRAIGFPYTSRGTDGYVEVLDVEAPAEAVIGVAGMISTMDGVHSAEVVGA